MIRLTFTDRDGRSTDTTGVPGERLLDAARRAAQPLEGTCGGAMACGTCLVTLAAADAGRLPPPSEDEEDMLDLLPQASRHSRLACQIVLAPALDGLGVAIAGA